MNSVLTPIPDRTAHPPGRAWRHPARLLDRAAMRIGMTLVLWSLRTQKPAPTREELTNLHRERAALAEREAYAYRHYATRGPLP